MKSSAHGNHSSQLHSTVSNFDLTHLSIHPTTDHGSDEDNEEEEDGDERRESFK